MISVILIFCCVAGAPTETLLLPIGAIAGIAVASTLSVILTVIVVVVCYYDRPSFSGKSSVSTTEGLTSRGSSRRNRSSRNGSTWTTDTNRVSDRATKNSTTAGNTTTDASSSAQSDTSDVSDRSDYENDASYVSSSATSSNEEPTPKHISKLTPSPKKKIGNVAQEESSSTTSLSDRE